MARFSYTVINKENQELTGKINAPDIKHAREELGNLGLSVITIEEIKEGAAEEAEKTGTVSFDFEAFDITGRKILGRIKEKDRASAYLRLRSEYNFSVTGLVSSDSTAQEKAMEKNQGFREFEEQYAKTKALLAPTAAETGIESDFEQQQELLVGKVEFTIKKVEEFLEKFTKEIRPEEEKLIKGQIDKIKLLKTSTNFEHIQGLCEELLKKIQEQGIFLHKDQFLKEKTAVAIEAKKLISDIKKPTKKPKDIFESLKSASISSPESFFGRIGVKISEIFRESPEIVQIKTAIRAKNVNLLEYMKLYFHAGTSAEKEEIKMRLHDLYMERRDLKHKLSQLKHALDEKEVSVALHKREIDIIGQIHAFFSWLLGFYLLYYFVGVYLSSKQILFETIPGGFFVYDSYLFKYLLPIVFITHAAISIRQYFFPRSILAILSAPPLILFASILIIFNF